MVFPGGVGHGALVSEVDHVGFDRVRYYIYVGRVHGVLAADPGCQPPLEELELLAVVVYRPGAPAACVLGVQEEVDRVPEVEPLGGTRCPRRHQMSAPRVRSASWLRSRVHAPSELYSLDYRSNLTQNSGRFSPR